MPGLLPFVMRLLPATAVPVTMPPSPPKKQPHQEHKTKEKHKSFDEEAEKAKTGVVGGVRGGGWRRYGRAALRRLYGLLPGHKTLHITGLKLGLGTAVHAKQRPQE